MGVGRWGAVGRLKQALKHEWQCCTISRRPRMAQLTGKSRSAVRISLAPHAALLMALRGHTGHEMHPRGLTALGKSRLVKQTWPSSLKCLVSLDSVWVSLSSTDKNGFQYLCPLGWFLQIQSHIVHSYKNISASLGLPPHALASVYSYVMHVNTLAFMYPVLSIHRYFEWISSSIVSNVYVYCNVCMYFIVMYKIRQYLNCIYVHELNPCCMIILWLHDC